MKRRTAQNVGRYPNMRDDTLKNIAAELLRARKKYPRRGSHMQLLESYTKELHDGLFDNHRAAQMGGRGVPAVQIYALAGTVAALAIRIMEEGSSGFAYAGNVWPPDLELTNVGNDRAD